MFFFYISVSRIFSVLGQIPNPLDLIASLETIDKVITTFSIINI